MTKSILQDLYVSGIISGIIAGLLTILVVEFWRSISRALLNRRFKSLFAKQNSRLNLIVPGFSVRSDLINSAVNSSLPNAEFPLAKQGGGSYASSRLIGNSDVKALKYLSDEISNRLNYSPQLWLDDDLDNRLDLDFISFGGSNFYCKQILNASENAFFVFDNSLTTITSKISKKQYRVDAQTDYGLIIKFKDVNFRNRIWITIAGISETGTSGSGWYLSKYWRNIQKKAGPNEFALLLRLQKGVDQSARVIEAYYRTEYNDIYFL